MHQVLEAGLTAVLHVAVVAVLLGPLIWWRARRGNYPVLAAGGRRRLAAAAVVYIAAVSLWDLPRAGIFAELSWNWQNKLLVAALLVVAVRFWPGLTWREVGLRVPRRGWWIPVLAISAAMLGLGLAEPQMSAVDAETVWYQAIVPGLDEELLFRGVLLVVLSRALTARRQMWRGEVGWEVPATCLLFAFGHGLSLTEGLGVQTDLVAIISTGVLGLALVWIRLRWDSLWPAILAHNGINSAAVLAAALAG